MATLTPEEIAAKQQEICNLTCDLTSAASDCGDWKIAKYNEYILAGLPAPYDIAEVHATREAKRERIRQLREELAA